MSEIFSRTERLIGAAAVKKLNCSRVAVFGIGGVGGYIAEALARAGVGAIDLIDSDKVSLSNINRQIYALNSTVGKLKTEVAKERILDINPDCAVKTYDLFYTPENANLFDFKAYDYIADAVDTVTSKMSLVEKAEENGVRIISAMGAGNKLDPTGFSVADIYQTSGCPLARVMRTLCKKRGIKSLKVVYSAEKSVTPLADSVENSDYADETAVKSAAAGKTGNRIPASISFVPPVVGFIMAGEIIKDIIGK